MTEISENALRQSSEPAGKRENQATAHSASRKRPRISFSQTKEAKWPSDQSKISKYSGCRRVLRAVSPAVNQRKFLSTIKQPRVLIVLNSVFGTESFFEDCSSWL